MLFHAVVQAEVYLKMRGCPRAAPDEFQRVNTEMDAAAAASISRFMRVYFLSHSSPVMRPQVSKRMSYIFGRPKSSFMVM